MPGAQDVLQEYSNSRSHPSTGNSGDAIGPPLASQKRKHGEIADTTCIWDPFRIRVREAHLTKMSAGAHLK